MIMWAYVYGSDGRLLLVCPKSDITRLGPPLWGYRVEYRRG